MDRFQLDLLEPRLLLAADGLAPLLKPVLFDGAAADRSRDTVALDERIESPVSDRLEWRVGEDSLFGGGEEALPAAAPEVVPASEATEPATSTPAVAAALASEVAAPTSDASVAAVPRSEPEPVLPFVPSRFASGEFEPGLPVGPPSEGEISGGLYAAEDAVGYDLTTLISDALAALKAHLAAWTAFYNLASIDWASHGGTVLTLPVMPDGLSDLFALADRLDSFDFPSLVADGKEALVTELTSLGFTVTAIEGGSGAIPETTGTDRILVSYTVTLATGFGVAGGYTGETFDTASEGLLDGVGSGLSTGDALAFTGSLVLELHFGVDDTGFFVAGGTGLALHVAADGSLSGSADVFGTTGSTVAIDAAVDIAVALGFADPATRYRVESIPGNLGTLLIATATGTADAKLTFTHGPTVLEFTAHYALSTAGFAVTQQVTLGLTGKLELPGFTVAATGDAAVLDLTGAYDSNTGTWTLTATTADLKAFGFNVKSALFSVTATNSAFSGSGSAAMEIDFLTHSLQPATFDLSASFNADTLTIDATLSLADLIFGSNGGSAFLTTGPAQLTLSLTGNFATSSLAGTIGFSLASATLSPGQSSSYSATFTDGDDADAFALTGSYDFGTQSLTLTADTFEFLVANVVKVTAVGALVTYSRSSNDDDQDLVTLNTIDVELLAFANAGTSEAPKFSATTVVLRESGFSIANGTLTAGDLTIGNILRLDAPTLTVDGLSYAAGAFAGTIAITTTGATVLPGVSAFTATLTDGTDADAFALTGNFTLATAAFALDLDTFTLTVPNAFAATGTGATLTYNPSDAGRQEIFTLASLELSFLSLKIGNAPLTASVSNLSVYTDGFTVENISLPANATPLGTVRVGEFLELTNPTLELNGLGYTTADGLVGTITISADAVALFPGGTAFTTTLSDGADANTFALFGTFDVATLAFELTVDEFAISVPNVFSANGSNVVIRYNPSVSGPQEIFALESFTMTFLSLQTAGGANLTASVTKLSIFTDGFAVENISLPANATPLGAVRVGSFLELTNPTLAIDGLKYDANGLVGTITISADAVALFPGGTAFTTTLSDGADTNSFALFGTFDVATLAFELTVDEFAISVPNVFSANGSNVVIRYNPSVSGPQEIFALESFTMTFLSLQTAGDANLTASVTKLSIFTDGFAVENISLPANATPLGAVRVGSFLELTNPMLAIDGLKYDANGLVGTITISADAVALFPGGTAFTTTLSDGADANSFALFGTFDVATLAFELTVDEFAISVPDVFSANGSNVVIRYNPSVSGPQEIFALESFTMTFLSLQTAGGANLTASVTKLSIFTDGFAVENISLPANATPLGAVRVGSFLELTNPTLAIDGLKYDANGLVGTITISADAVALFPGGTAFTTTLSDGADANTFALFGTFDVATLAFELTVDEFAISVPNVFSANGSNVVIRYNPSVSGQQEIFALESFTMTFLSLQTAGGANLTASVTKLSIFTDGFAVENISLPANATPLGAVRVGSFLELTNPTLAIDGLKYDANGLVGTITISADAVALFPGGTAFTTTLSDGADANTFALFGTFDVATLAFELTVDEFAISVPNVFSANGSNVVIRYNPSVSGPQEIFALESFTMTFLSLQTAGGANLTASVSKLSIFTDGFAVENISLPANATPLGAVRVGSFLELTNPTLAIDGLKYDANGLVGTITISADAVALFPGGTAFTTTLSDGADANTFALFGTFDVATLAFELTVDEFAISVPNVFSANGSNVVIRYNPSVSGPQEIFALESFTMTFMSLQTAGGANLTASVTKLSIFTDGFAVENISLPANATPLGAVRVGSFLELTNPTLAIDGLKYDANGLVGTITISADAVALFPGGTAFTTTLSDGADANSFALFGTFDVATLAFELTVDEFAISVPNVFSANGSNVVIRYNPSLSGPQEIFALESFTMTFLSLQTAGGANLTASVTKLSIFTDGFAVENISLPANATPLGAVRVGSFLELTNPTLHLTGLSYNSTDGLAGQIEITADNAVFFPGSAFTAMLSDGTDADTFAIDGHFDLATTAFALHIDQLSLQLGEAVHFSGSGIDFAYNPTGPPSQQLVGIDELDVTSPLFDSFGTVKLTSFKLRADGFSFSNLSLAQTSTEARIGNFLAISGALISADNFDVTFGGSATVTGSITLTATSIKLFPDGGLITSTVADFSASYVFRDGGAGELKIVVGTFGLRIGEALAITASNVIVTPSADPILTLAQAVVTSPLLASFGSAVVENLVVGPHGFSVENLTLAQPAGQTTTIGNFLAFSGVQLVVAGAAPGESFTVNYGGAVEGTITLTATSIQLFPNGGVIRSSLTDFVASFDFSAGGQLAIEFSSFSLAIGEALLLTAADTVTITPGQTQLASIGRLDVTSPMFAQVNFEVLNFVLFQHGFELDSATLTLGDIATPVAAFAGAVLRVAGADETSKFAVNYGDGGTSISGAIELTVTSLKLFPTATFLISEFDGLDVYYDFNDAGRMRIHLDSFVLQVGEALRLEAAGPVDLYPGSATVATIASLAVTSPQFGAGAGSFTVTDFVIRENGFYLGNGTLSIASISLGGAVTLETIVLTATDFDLTITGTGTEISGTLALSIGSAALFPNGGYLTSSLTAIAASYDFEDGTGSLRITVGDFEMRIGEALAISAHNVELTPGATDVIARIASATITAPVFAAFGSATVTDLEITPSGFSLESLTLEQADGAPVTIGNFLSFSGLKIFVEGEDAQSKFTVTVGSAPSGRVRVEATSVALFPNGGVITSDLQGFSAEYDFDGDGALTISFTRFALAIGEALHLVASSAEGAEAPVTISPSAPVLVTIPYLMVSSPLIAGLAPAQLTNLQVRPDGFSFTSATIGQAPGTRAMIGSFLEFEGVTVTASGPVGGGDFAVNYGAGGVTIAGEITFTAASLKLFPNATFLTTSVTGLVGTYAFAPGSNGALSLSLETLQLDVGEAIRLSAGTVGVPNGIVITPGEETILQINSLTVTSPLITSGLNSFTLQGFSATRDGFAFDVFTLSQVPNATATIGSFLSFTGLAITVNNFVYSETNGVSGAVLFSADSIALFPSSNTISSTLTGISGSFDFAHSGSLEIAVQTFQLLVGDAVRLDATGVTLTPGAPNVLATITTATANSPRLAGLPSINVDNLTLRRDGLSFTSLTIAQPTGAVANFGNFLSFSGVVLTVAGPESGGDFDLTFGDGGTTTLAGSITIQVDALTLFPDATFLTSTFTGVTGSFDFAGGAGSMIIAVDSFTLAVGDAFKLSASGVDAQNPILLRPGNDVLVANLNATVTSSLIAGLGEFSLTDFELTRTGFSVANLTLAQAGGATATIGSVLSFTGAALALDNFAVAHSGGDWTVQGSATLTVDALTLFPSATFLTSAFTGLQASFDFSSAGSLAIQFDTMTLRIGTALEISVTQAGSQNVFTPGQQTILTLGNLAVSAPGIQGMGTATLSRLVVRHDGLSIGTLTLSQAVGQTAQFGSFLTMTGAQLTVNNFSLVNNDGAISVSGGIVFTADSLNLFPGASGITSSLTAFTGSYVFGGAHSGQLEITVGTFQLKVGTALEVNASGVTLRPGEATIAQVNNATLRAPSFTQLPEIQLSGLTVTTTGFHIDAFSLEQGSGIARFGDVLAFQGLKISATGVDFTFGGAASLESIIVTATQAAVFPGNSTFSATVDGFTGSYAGGALTLTAATFTFQFGTSLKVVANGLVFSPESTTLIAHADDITASLPSLGVSGSGTGLDIKPDGSFSVVSVTIDTSNLAQAIGLGELLPFNINTVALKFLGDTNNNGQKDDGEVFSLTQFDLTVTGTFDFAKMGSLPFTPIVQIGPQNAPQSFSNSTDSFSFTIEVVDGAIRPKDIGPITLGFADLKVGSTVTMAGSIKLGGYADGQWVSSFGGSIALTTNSAMSGITGAAVSILGSYDGNAGRLVAFANLTVSFQYGDTIKVQNAGLGFNLIVSSGSGGSITLEKLELTSASVENVTLSLGTYLTLSANNVALNFNPGPGDYIASFGSMSATVKVGDSFTVTGTARHFAIDASGQLAALPGFGVSLTFSDPAAIKWPSWLPIQITAASLAWDNFDAHPFAFTITLSATVSSINGLDAFKVQGAFNGLVIDLGMLEQGKFPITSIGSAGVSITGDAFGGKIEGTLILGVVKMKGGQKLPSDSTEVPDDHILYGAIQAGFSFAGAAGFSIRIGLSSIGPLQLYMEASIPVLLDPDTGLSITDFRAGVIFGTDIPDPGDDPRALAGASYQPVDKILLPDWIAQLENQVVALADSGHNFWSQIGSHMVFQAGATLFSQYLSIYTFRAEIDFLFDTTGKFIIDAAIVYGDTLTQSASLYFDLSKLADGSGKILFLAREPSGPGIEPLVTIYGELSFGFTRTDGTEVSPTNPADAFQIRLSGGVDFKALSFLTATIEGSVTMEFTTTRFDLFLDGHMSLSYIGDALAMSGALHIERVGSDVNVWGALLITTPALGKLEQVGVFANGSFIVRLNFTDNAYTETLTLPNGTKFDVELPKQSFSVLVEGFLIFKLEGQEWFRVVGSFGMELSATGLTVFGVGDLLVGPAANPWITFSFDGLFRIGDQGVAGLLDLSLKNGFPESTGITLTGSYLLEFNTSPSGEDITYTLPASVVTIPGGGDNRTLTISGTAPVDGATPGPYLVVSGTMDLGVLGFVFHGHFDFIVTTSLLRIATESTLSLAVAGVQIFLFDVRGGFQVDGKGIVAAFNLTRNVNTPSLDGFGFGLNTSFQLELNTTNAVATVAGIDLKAGRYARVSMHGDLTIAGLTLNGDFQLTAGENLLSLSADASLDLTIAGKTLFQFHVLGGFQIDNHGIAAAFTIDLKEEIPDSTFTFQASFTLQVNMTGREVQIATTTLEAGNYFRIAAHGDLALAGFTITGDFLLTVSTTAVHMEATAAMEVDLGNTTLFKFAVTGGLEFNERGLAAVLSLALATGPPSHLGFAFSAAFDFRLNTTNADVVFAGVTAKAGKVLIHAHGNLAISGFTLVGDFELSYGNGDFTVAASATLDLSIGGTRLLGFTVSGGLSVNEQGIAAAFAISLQSDASFPAGYGISLSVSFQLQINTRSVGVTIVNTAPDGTQVPTTLLAGPYAQVQLSGSLTIFGFNFTGTFYVSAGAGQFTLGGSASFSLFGTSASVLFDFGLFSDGMAGRVDLAINTLNVANLFALKGKFGLEFNTTHRTVFDIAKQTGQVYVKNGELVVLGLTMRGTVYIGVSNGKFQIVIPASDPLTLDFFGIVTVQVSGYVRDDGNFSITGSVALSLGARSLVSIEGRMTVTVANSGIAASISGSLWVFNQSVAALSGHVVVNDSGFRLVATVNFKLPDPFSVISLNGNLDLTVGSGGIKGSISASISLWGFLNGSVGAYLDTGTGSWFVSGSAGFSVGNDDIGARGSLTIGVGYLSQGMYLFGANRSPGMNTSVRLEGSAWAGIKIAGHHIGISGGLSASIDLGNAVASVTIHGKVVGIKFSKTITVDFRNGIRVHLSDVAGSIVYLDVNRNGRFDPGEPTTTADGNGYFHFSADQVISPVAPPAPTPFAVLDVNGNGFIDDSEGVFYVTGGTRISDGSAGGAPSVLEHDLVSGLTEFAGATVFIDTNNNGVLDPGEYAVTTDANGAYDFSALLFPATPIDQAVYLGAQLAPFDLNHNGIIDADEGVFVLTGGTDLATGLANPGLVVLTGGHATGFTGYAGATVFLDRNGNRLLDPGELSVVTEDNGQYSFVTDITPDVRSGSLGSLAIYDTNKNGILDPSEGQLYVVGGFDADTGAPNTGAALIGNDHLSGYAPFYQFERVFFDVNGNGAYDAGEPTYVFNGTSFYTFNEFAAPTNALGSLAPYDTNGNGRIDPEEGIFRILGGQDVNNGAANEQTIVIQGDGAGGGIRRTASPLANIVDLLQVLGTGNYDPHLVLSAALGMPYYIDFETFDPSVSQEQNPDSGFHHEVEGVAAQVAALLLNGSDALIGAANGNLSAETAQTAILNALVQRIRAIAPDDQPPVDADGNLIAAAAKLDITDPEIVHQILQDAAASLQITFTEEPTPASGAPSFRFVAALSVGTGPTFLHQGAVVRANTAGGIQLVLPESVSRTAATVIGVQNDHIDELVDHRVTNITEALARVKFIAQLHSSDRLGLLALGQGNAADLIDDFDYDSLLEAIDGLVLPYGNLPPGVAIVGDVTTVAGEAIRLPFTVTDPDALPTNLHFTVTSSDGRVVAPTGVTVEGTGMHRVLVIQPNGELNGSTMLTLTVSDGAVSNSTHSVAILVTVLPDASVTRVEQVYDTQGRQVMRFTVTLSGASNTDIELIYQTVDGAAKAGLDYVGADGRLVIPAGATTATIDIVILSDPYLLENPESFTLRLSIESGAHLIHRDFEGTIVDRDVPIALLVPTQPQDAAAWSFLPRTSAAADADDALLPAAGLDLASVPALAAFSFNSLAGAVQLEQLEQLRTLPTL